MGKLRSGVYARLVEEVRKQKDLNMDFRGKYINMYFKGHNVLRLHDHGGWYIHPHFKIEGIPRPLRTREDADEYLKRLPMIKDKVSRHPTQRIEAEYEQLIIRANNKERRSNSEYIIVDRQYAYEVKGEAGKKRRQQWDLVAIKCPQKALMLKHPKGYLTLIEVKYGLDPSIAQIANQIEPYYKYLKENFDRICDDMQLILQQKVELGLIERKEDQKRKLMKLELDRQPQSAEVIVYLLDYNPFGRQLGIARPKLQELGFAGQIRIGHGGSAMWVKNLKGLWKWKDGS